VEGTLYPSRYRRQGLANAAAGGRRANQAITVTIPAADEFSGQFFGRTNAGHDLRIVGRWLCGLIRRPVSD
jgi:hypothetical protein